MAKRPSEIFGYPFDVRGPQAQAARERHGCPFVNQRCDKKSRLIPYPMGVCSVQHNDGVVAICPKRFLQDEIVFKEVADHYFGTRNNLVVFAEVGLSGIGSYDYVIVKHRPLSSGIEDFVVVEFQTNQTTSTGKLVQALEDFVRGEMDPGRVYGFGLNTYDTLKRSFTQILNKGVVLENWGQRIYWVFQEPVYQNYVSRYNLGEMAYDSNHTTVFVVYDLERGGDSYHLVQTRIESSTIDDLFKAFRNNPDIPAKDGFVETLQKKLKARMELKLRWDR